MPPQLDLLKPAELSKKKAAVVERFAQIKNTANRMLDLLDDGIVRDGYLVSAVALSHAQVDTLPFTFFVVERRFKHFFGDRRIIINAKITDQKDLVPFEEGCLSFLGRPHYQTKRFRTIEVEWQFPNGTGEIHRRPHKERYEGLAAMIIQHEIDHANGENIYDKFLEENRPPKK
jgi:peptide deformylase